MGMFDEVWFLDGGPTCGEGHELVNVSLQTKDLECNLDHYTISKGELRLHWAHPVCKTPEGEVGKRIVVPKLNVYTHCELCAPVWGESRRMLGGRPFLQALQPWNEWMLHFTDGKLERIEVWEKQTRKSVRKLHAKQWNLLDEDDPRALEQTKIWRATRAEYGGLGRGALQKRPVVS